MDAFPQRRGLFCATISVLLLLAACRRSAGLPTLPGLPPAPEPAGVSSSSSSSSPEAAAETYVTERGVVREQSPGIVMEGTHLLLLEDGDEIFLTSEVYDLSSYLGKEVEVSGYLRDTVEGNRAILRVEHIAVVGGEEEPSASSTVPEAAFSSPPPPPPTASVSSPKRVPASSRAPETAPPSTASSARMQLPPPPETGGSLSAEMQARIKKMAKERDESAWTQQYCSAHLGLRFPVRADYWYKSFGATTSVLWHVEVSSEEIDALGDGPLSVNAVSGRLESIEDGSTAERDGLVIGYRSWTDNRHVEVVAPRELRAIVEYITRNLGTCEG